MFKEFLDAIRTTHLLLIVVSAAVLFFALSPRDSELYGLAKAEIDSLQKVQFEGYLKSVAPTAQSAIERRADSLKIVLSREQRDFKVSPSLGSQGQLVTAWPDDSSKLKDILAFFEGPNEISVPNYVIDAQLLPSLRSAVAKYNSQKCVQAFTEKPVPCGKITKDFRLELVDVEIVKHPDVTITIPIRREKYTFDLEIPVYKDFPLPHTCKIDFIFTRDDEKETAIATEAIACQTQLAVKGNLALDWIKRTPTQASALLTTVQPGTVEILFHSRAVWDQISGMTRAEAARFLGDKVRSSRQTVSVGGLSLDERLVTLLAPPLLVAIEVYLLAQIIMLRTALNRRLIKMQAYPWVGMFDGTLPFAISVFTTVLLPCLSLIWLLRSIKRFTEWSGIEVMIGSLTVLACGSTVLVLLKRLRASLPVVKKEDAHKASASGEAST
jgi:hypothetical protein